MKALLISADGCTQLLDVPDGQTAIARVLRRRVIPSFSVPDPSESTRFQFHERTYVRGMRPAVLSSGLELHVFEEEP